jgi:hypothetical protein
LRQFTDPHLHLLTLEYTPECILCAMIGQAF